MQRLEARFDLLISIEERLKRLERKIDFLDRKLDTSIDLSTGVAEVAAKAMNKTDKIE